MQVRKQNRRLNDREEKFAQVYVETHNTITAYKQAGYKWGEGGKAPGYLKSKVSMLVHRPTIAARIKELESKQLEDKAERAAFTLDMLRDKFTELGEENHENKNMSEARLNYEALGRTMGAFKDVHLIDASKQREYSLEEEIEGRRLASLMVSDKLDKEAEDCAGDTIIDVKVLTDNKDNVPTIDAQSA